MDVQSVDAAYGQLQTQADTTIQELKALAGKLQTASQAGNPDAREWLLDLREIALAVQAEQNQVFNLLQQLHGFVENQARAVQTLPASVPQSLPQASWQQQPQQPNYPPQGYPQQAYPQGYQGGYPQQGGGVLGGLFNSGFGRAILTGAGFGIGDDLINKIF
jgi:ABC-type transporter Mla subunit MlaD